MELKIWGSQVASSARSASRPGVKRRWNTNRSKINATNERNQGLALKVGIVKGGVINPIQEPISIALTRIPTSLSQKQALGSSQHCVSF